MKTTIEISDPLLNDARAVAQRHGTTLRALVEQGLRQVISEKRNGKGPFKLRDGSVGGRGLRPELAEAGWDKIRRISYGDRG